MCPGSVCSCGSGRLVVGLALPAFRGVVFPQCSRGPQGALDGVSAVVEQRSGLVARLRADASAGARLGLLSRLEERDDGATLAVGTAFAAERIAQRFADQLAAHAATLGIARVRIIVDPDLPEHSDEPAIIPPAAVSEGEVRETVAAAREPRPAIPGVVAKLLAERGFFTLSPTREAWAADDIKGRLSVEPAASGAPGVSEACVFTGLVSIWAYGSRAEPVVETSLTGLCEVLGWSWSGRAGAQLRLAIERLKTTTYRTTVPLDDGVEEGGVERLFSLLDEIETTWRGPESSPRRRVRAVFSRTAFQLIKAPKMLRPIDLVALHRLGHQRDLARRLYLLLEASTGHAVAPGVEVVERLVDERLAITLGTQQPAWKLAQQLRPACAAIEATAARYARVELIPRRKRRIEHGDPRFLLRAERARLIRTRRTTT